MDWPKIELRSSQPFEMGSAGSNITNYMKSLTAAQLQNWQDESCMDLRWKHSLIANICKNIHLSCRCWSRSKDQREDGPLRMLPPGGWSWGRIRITCTHVMSVIELVCTADCTLWVMWYFYSRVHWRLEVVLELGDHNLWAFWTQVQVSLWPWQSTVLYVKLSLSCWFCERKPGIFV